VSELGKIHIATSGWSYDGWLGPFYPEGTQKRDYLSCYSERFPLVEVDSTFYTIPRESTVQNWVTRTPSDFRFALKVPGSVTHGAHGERPNVDKVLRDEAGDLDKFLDLVRLLGDKLGPILFQFPYFRVKEFDVADFVSRLSEVLSRLPTDLRFAVEIRNKSWIKPTFLNLLRKHRVALALIDHPYMELPLAQAVEERFTTDFGYVRLLGDRYSIEKTTKTWDKLVLDKERRLLDWAEVLICLARSHAVSDVFAFSNNHFAGHGPATCRQLSSLLEQQLEATSGLDDSDASGDARSG